jgi:hypothetical protein
MLSREIKEYESGIAPANDSLKKTYIKPHATPATMKGNAHITSSDFCRRMLSSSSLGSHQPGIIRVSVCWNKLLIIFVVIKPCGNNCGHVYLK